MRYTLMAALCVMLALSISSCGGGGAPDVNETGKNMDAIAAHMFTTMADDARKKRLRDPKLKDKSGAAGFGAAVQAGVYDDSILKFLVIPGTGDDPADAAEVKSSGSLTTANCSFCGPKLTELLVVMSSKESKRCVVLCPNSKHWAKFGEAVPILFSDSDRATLTTRADLSLYDITEADWADPAGKLFGKKAPFDKVYE
jgi:hypothetical protein